MVAVTLNLYDKWREHAHDGGAVNFETPGGNGLKVSIVTNTYTPNQNLHEFWDDGPEANEVSGTNYTLDGNATTGTVTIDGAGLVTIDCSDPTAWAQSASGFSNGRRVIVWLDTGVSATSTLIAYSDAFAADKGNVDGEFSVTFAAAGLCTQAR